MSAKQTAVAAGLAALCIAPSAVANVLPHVASMINDSAEATTAVFQDVSVIAMAAMPFGIQNLRAVTLKLACWLLAIVLFGLNLLNALDAASHARATATGVAHATITTAAALNSRLPELRKSRAQVPPFTLTSAAQATAAQKATDEAVRARDAECGKLGPNCRKRTDEAAAAAEKLSVVLANRAPTERAEKLDAEIAALDKQLLDLGPVPKHSDDTAAKTARLIGLFVSMSGHADEAIAEWRPIAFAIGIELLALIGPLGMMAAVSPARTVSAMQQPAISRKVNISRERAALETAMPATPLRVGFATTAAAESVASPAKPKKAKQIKPTRSGVGVGDVRKWHASRTAARPGNTIRCNEVYSAYVEWCKSKGLEACSLTKFGGLMKGDLGVEYVEKSKRGYYVGFALKVELSIVASA